MVVNKSTGNGVYVVPDAAAEIYCNGARPPTAYLQMSRCRAIAVYGLTLFGPPRFNTGPGCAACIYARADSLCAPGQANAFYWSADFNHRVITRAMQSIRRTEHCGKHDKARNVTLGKIQTLSALIRR